jgi:hypothetical protein
MSSKSTNSSTADTMRDAAVAGGRTVPEMSRQQFVRNADWMAASFRTTSELQTVTMQMCQRAALMHMQAAENARKASSPVELMQVQSALVVHQWQEMARFSQEWMLACTRAMAQSAVKAADAGTTASANGTVAAAAAGPVAPMVDAWQKMFAGLAPDTTGAGH